MKRLILMIIAVLFTLVGCAKEKNIAFEATIKSVSEKSMIVSTDDNVGFDKASVWVSTAKVEGDLTEGKKVKITIEPEVRETYPVQVTATKIEVIDGAIKKYSLKKQKK